MARRWWLWLALLAAGLHAQGIARSILPAQDGLKFLRVARELQHGPWTEAIRGSDQHPLYPACIAALEPAAALALGRGPDTWRVAAQAVSALASLVLLIPLYRLTRALFDEPTARLAVLIYVLLPLPAEVGHDTLSDALALLAFTAALAFGEAALRQRRAADSLACGLASGLGFWARPEVAVLPATVCALALLRSIGRRVASRSTGPGRSWRLSTVSAVRWSAFGVAFLALVGAYALVKGEVSEKLALRRGAAVASRHDAVRRVPHPLPRGMSDPRWDFSPKEESAHPERLGATAAGVRVLRSWAEGCAWVFAALAIWGAFRARAGSGKALVALYLVLFGAILVRHAMLLGYLSGRHVLTVVVATMPWAAAGTMAVARGAASRFAWDEPRRRRRAALALAVLVVAGVIVQAKPAHASRWGHWAAGRWLAEHATEDEAVLDTRGWAAFVAGRGQYDYWHVRQALTDSRLTYVVVGADELEAPSRRGATLRALLHSSGKPVAAFPDRRGGDAADVRVYRFRRPASWEGLTP